MALPLSGQRGMSAPSSVASSARQGMLWLFGQSVVSRALQAAAQIALAWLLVPADFGLIGLAYTITAIVGGLFSLGFEDVLLQRHRGLRVWTGTVFWMSLAAGFLGGVALLLAAPMAASLYGQAPLVGLIAIIALGAPIGALATIPSAILRASLNFRLLAAVSLGEAVFTSAFSIALAATGFGAYSFVLPVPFIAAGRVFVLWRAARSSAAARGDAKWDLAFPRRARRSWRLVPAASAALGTSLLTTIVAQGAYIALGLIVADAVAIGLYFFAFKLAVQPLRMLAGSFSAVLFPALVQYRNDPRRQRDAALQVSQMLSIVVMPLCFLQAALAASLLEVFFAPRWQGSAPIVQLLSLGLAFDASSWAAGAFLNARGEFKRGFVYSLIAAPVFIAVVSAGALIQGSLGVAAAVALFYALLAPVYCYAVFRQAGSTGWREIARIYAGPALLSGAATGVSYACVAAVWPSPLALLCATPLLTISIYVPLLRLVCPEPYRRVRQQVFALRRPRAVLAA